MGPGELARHWRAIVLSPSIEICESLLRHERVPLSRLDQQWIARLGGGGYD
jgi:hypothetical protein